MSYNAANLGAVFASDAVMTVTDGKETKVRNGINEIKAACQATFNRMKALKAYFNIVSASPIDGGQVTAEYNMMVGDAMLGNMKDTYTLEEDANGQYLIKNMLSVQTNSGVEEVVVTKRRRRV